jgi:hypothetical protein
MCRNLWNDELGFVISAELVLVLTVGVQAVIVGLSEVAVAVNTELNDISNAIGALTQTYAYTGFKGTDSGVGAKVKSFINGSAFIDAHDDCDDNLSCDVVCGAPLTPTCG